MKRALMLLVKYVNHFTNDRLTPEQEANSILQYLLLKNSTTHSIEIFEALESKFHSELRNRERVASNEVVSIASYLPAGYNEIMNMTVNDPIFEKPIKN